MVATFQQDFIFPFWNVGHKIMFEHFLGTFRIIATWLYNLQYDNIFNTILLQKPHSLMMKTGKT